MEDECILVVQHDLGYPASISRFRQISGKVTSGIAKEEAEKATDHSLVSSNDVADSSSSVQIREVPSARASPAVDYQSVS